MKLTALKTYICDAYRTNWCFVKIETDSGHHGWGEATLEYREPTVTQAVRELERGLVNRDLRNIEAWWQDAYRDAYWRGGPVLMSALSAIEMALWDIKGKSLGVPVHQLLGGRVRDAVPCYANAWFANAKTPAEFAAAATKAVAMGYRALKWDPFGATFRHLSAAQLRDALAVVEAVKNAVGTTAELLIEGHGRFELPTARRIARALEDYDIQWFEEPLIPGNLENYARLRRETRTPISMGERLYTRWEFREVFESGCADFIQPDVSHAGGIWELRKIATLAELWQIPFCPHNPSGPVANAATLQLAACTPNFLYLETMATDVPWRAEVAQETCRFANGEMHISDAPGLGVEINEDALAAYPYQVHDLRHYTGALTAIRPPDAKATF
ncbi:galactonate dehydratase [Geminisphaera colitermitum]|uniref:galactonate dehydratase n=1 Tax=Geminisphaera colitermitum TaxID=1148786 RepID=UPI0005BB4AA3|nr:galactonate dehydratase [Geminisphaera colitermitum]